MFKVEYKEFLKQPEVEQNFNHTFNRQKEYYRQKCSSVGFDKEHTELLSIKMAFINTDLLFTEMHNKDNNINGITENKKGG